MYSAVAVGLVQQPGVQPQQAAFLRTTRRSVSGSARRCPLGRRQPGAPQCPCLPLTSGHGSCQASFRFPLRDGERRAGRRPSPCESLGLSRIPPSTRPTRDAELRAQMLKQGCSEAETKQNNFCIGVALLPCLPSRAGFQEYPVPKKQISLRTRRTKPVLSRPSLVLCTVWGRVFGAGRAPRAGNAPSLPKPWVLRRWMQTAVPRQASVPGQPHAGAYGKSEPRYRPNPCETPSEAASSCPVHEIFGEQARQWVFG